MTGLPKRLLLQTLCALPQQPQCGEMKRIGTGSEENVKPHPVHLPFPRRKESPSDRSLVRRVAVSCLSQRH